jgi:hypothetical protein
MNTIKPNDASQLRELSDAELNGVAGGFSARVAQIWMNVFGATPTQGEAKGGGTSLTPAQMAKYS